ncbi:hypothetical protein [Rhodococcus sp. ACT016]|uniref:hypothetical protein n=1 Tax=Rhodococcus sp. ACT016 TaxID=3134808 RepID=UPI003D2AD540
MQIGDCVHPPRGGSQFTIVAENDDRFVIEAVEDALDRYAFPMKPEDLVPAE